MNNNDERDYAEEAANLATMCEQDDEDDACEGHESLAGEHMGEAVYCDGSCRRARPRS